MPLFPWTILHFRSAFSVNTDYMKVPVFPDCIDNFSDILIIFPDDMCKLDNLTLSNHTTFTWSVSAHAYCRLRDAELFISVFKTFHYLCLG